MENLNSTDSAYKELINAIQEGEFHNKVDLIAKHPKVLSYTPTPLKIAANTGSYEAVNFLLQATRIYRKDDFTTIMDAKDSHASRAIHSAVLSGNIQLVKLLIDNGADINVQNNRLKVTPLLHAIRTDNNGLAIAKLLLIHSADPSIQNQKGETALHVAIQRGDINKIRLLLEFGANIAIEDKNQDTPLGIAIKDRTVDIIVLCLIYSTERDMTGPEWAEAYSIVIKCYPALANLSNKQTSLYHLAVRSACYDRIEYLLENSDINTPDGEGLTHLQSAIDKKNIVIISLLLLYLGQDNIGNKKIEEACAITMQQHPTLEVLDQATFLLYLAVLYGSPQKIEHFLEAPYIKIYAQDSRGRTPLHVALIKKQQATTEKPPTVIKNY